MPASEIGMMERAGVWAGAGAAAGGLLGVAGAGFSRPAIGESSLKFVARSSITTSAELAGVAAIFAATDTTLNHMRGHSWVNGAVAGCLSGGLLGLRSGSIGNMAYGCGTFAVIQAFAGLGDEWSGGGH